VFGFAATGSGTHLASPEVRPVSVTLTLWLPSSPVGKYSNFVVPFAHESFVHDCGKLPFDALATSTDGFAIRFVAAACSGTAHATKNSMAVAMNLALRNRRYFLRWEIRIFLPYPRSTMHFS
jgi:hypothetical protein